MNENDLQIRKNRFAAGLTAISDEFYRAIGLTAGLLESAERLKTQLQMSEAENVRLEKENAELRLRLICQVEAPAQEVCRWIHITDCDQEGCWETACGHTWQFTDGSKPQENDQKFCGYCGRRLVECQITGVADGRGDKFWLDDDGPEM